MWCSGPGDFAGTGLPFRWTGSFDIHDCHVWYTSDICLYVLYPYLAKELYDMMAGLCETYRLVCDYDPDREYLEQYRPVVIRNLCKFELLMPKTDVGMLFHELKHIYDKCMDVPSHVTWMYIFERLVSDLIRMIHDRAHPEANLAKEKSFSIGLEDLIRCQETEIEEDVVDMENPKTRKIFEKFRILKSDAKVVEQSYVLPAKISGVRKMDSKSFESKSNDVNGFASMFGSSIHLQVLKPTWEIRVNGYLRRTVDAEPPIGVHCSYRRHSGFVLQSQKNRVGQILGFYLTDQRKLVAEVNTWEKYQGEESKLWLIKRKDVRRCVILAEELGTVWIFAPWTGKADIDKIDPDIQCVMKVRERPQ